MIYTYDRIGRPSVVTQGAGTTQNQHSYLYNDSNLQLSSESISYASGLVRTLNRTQDTYLRSTGFVLTNGTTTEHATSFGYDSIGRLAGVHAGTTYPVAPAQADFRYSYHANNAGLLATVEGPAHIVENTYETNRDILDVKANKLSSTSTSAISEFDYSVNAIGQRENVARSGDAFSSANTESWSYNAKGEVTSADHSTNNAFDRSYEFDGIGNRKKSADSLTLPTTDNYQANALNQLTEANGNTRVHDADGNITDNGTHLYTWDAENRLIEIKLKSDNSTVATYAYDYQSRRITKTVGGVETNFVYEGWNPTAVFTGTTLDKTYTWGMDLSGSMQAAGGVGGLLSVNDGSATYYPTFDGNGNVSEYVDATGAVVAHYEYDAFGKVVTSGTKANDFTHQFSSKQLDLESGLHYYGYRYYDSSNGRWLGRDPIEERGGANIYAFISNKAVSNYDILGLYLESGWDIANIGMGLYSLGSNVSEGNWGAAALDLGGVVVDGVATALPVVPGGAGAAIKAGRAADKANDARKAADKANDARKALDDAIEKARDTVRDAKKPNPHKKPTKKELRKGADPCPYACAALKAAEASLKARKFLACHPIENDPFQHSKALADDEQRVKNAQKAVDDAGCKCK